MNQDLYEGSVSVALMTAPLWVRVVIEINLVASAIAAVLGVIIGLHTIWNWQKHRGGR